MKQTLLGDFIDEIYTRFHNEICERPSWAEEKLEVMVAGGEIDKAYLQNIYKHPKIPPLPETSHSFHPIPFGIQSLPRDHLLATLSPIIVFPILFHPKILHS